MNFLIAEIIINFYLQKKEHPEILIFFSLKDLFNGNNVIQAAEKILQYKKLTALNNTTFDKNSFFEYLKNSISLFCIKTNLELKDILVQYESYGLDLSLMDIVNTSNFYINKDDNNKPTGNPNTIKSTDSTKVLFI